PAPATPAPTPGRPPSPQPAPYRAPPHRGSRAGTRPGRKTRGGSREEDRLDTGSSTWSLHPSRARHAEHPDHIGATHPDHLTQRDREKQPPDTGRDHSSP